MIGNYVELIVGSAAQSLPYGLEVPYGAGSSERELYRARPGIASTKVADTDVSTISSGVGYCGKKMT
jgi:hypothetical protein